MTARSGSDPIVVTGAAGFIGQHLVRSLVASGHRVVAVDCQPIPDVGASSVLQLDLRESDRTRVMMEMVRPSVVYHLAAESSVIVAEANPVATIDSNVVATGHLARCAADVGTQRFVFFSTSGAMYGESRADLVDESEPATPLSVYGVSKLAAEFVLEAIVRLSPLELSVLRPSNVYGPGQPPSGESGVVAIFAARMQAGLPLTLFGAGEHCRDYVHVDDVVRAAVLAASGTPGTCHVSTGVEHSTREVFDILAHEFAYTRPPELAPTRPGEIDGVAASPRRASELWGWSPQIGFEEGLRRTAAWYRSPASRFARTS